MWFNILKAPIYPNWIGDEPHSKKDEGFDLLNRIRHTTPSEITFISKDGNCRADFYLAEHFGRAAWYLQIFEIRESIRGKGLGESYLKEMIDELRRDEKNILDEILEGLDLEEAKIREEANNEIYNILEQFLKPMKDIKKIISEASPPLDVIAIHVGERPSKWWDKMVDKGLIAEWLD